MSVPIFKPHRGRSNVMSSSKKNIVLEDGELFVEIPDTITGDNQYKFKIGDGVTSYESLKYAVDPIIDTVVTNTGTHAVNGAGIYTALTNGTVSKVGTSTIGGQYTPMYLNAGIPTPGLECSPKNHATNTTTYGGGTASNYGHVKLCDTYGKNDGQASNSIAASPKAVYDAYVALNNNIATAIGDALADSY